MWRQGGRTSWTTALGCGGRRAVHRPSRFSTTRPQMTSMCFPRSRSLRPQGGVDEGSPQGCPQLWRQRCTSVGCCGSTVRVGRPFSTGVDENVDIRLEHRCVRTALPARGVRGPTKGRAVRVDTPCRGRRRCHGASRRRGGVSTTVSAGGWRRRGRVSSRPGQEAWERIRVVSSVTWL